MKKIKSISIADDTWQKAKELAAREGRSLSNFITFLINNYVKK